MAEDPIYHVGLVRLDEIPPPVPRAAVRPEAPSLRAVPDTVVPQSVPPAPKAVPTSKPSAPAPATPKLEPVPESVPPALPAPKVISSRMNPNIGLLEQMRDDLPPPPRPEDLPVAVEKDGTVYVAGTHGFATFADTFNLERCGADTFEPEDFFGHYRVGSRRFVSVIDGLDKFGGFLFYDSQTGMFRKLKQVSNMIFTYGPSFSREGPVAGSVTILPKKDRYQNKYIKKPNQLIWLPEDPPMRYGTLIEFAETELNFDSAGTTLTGTLITRPEGGRVPGVVLTFCTGCIRRDQARGFAQALALHGLAVLIYDVRTCVGPPAQGEAGLRVLGEDALAAVRALRSRPEVDPDRVGLWGKDNGAQVALAAASMGVEADFLVLTYAQAGPVNKVSLPPPPRPGGVLVPALWLFSGTRPKTLWREHMAAVEHERSTRGRDFNIMVLPDETEQGAPDAPALQPLSLRYGGRAAPWIKGLR
ncbi:alpha/beta hydrolase family protein [Desulfovibrio ferrophilus]|nr:hypothetical protein [Desulfovibrio ferrophilus]